MPMRPGGIPGGGLTPLLLEPWELPNKFSMTITLGFWNCSLSCS